jgi:hypothetical protein
MAISTSSGGQSNPSCQPESLRLVTLIIIMVLYIIDFAGGGLVIYLT